MLFTTFTRVIISSVVHDKLNFSIMTQEFKRKFKNSGWENRWKTIKIFSESWSENSYTLARFVYQNHYLIPKWHSELISKWGECMVFFKLTFIISRLLWWNFVIYWLIQLIQSITSQGRIVLQSVKTLGFSIKASWVEEKSVCFDENQAKFFSTLL